jgi:ABC-2 type transport system permease protein
MRRGERETPLAMEESIDVAVYAGHADASAAAPLHVAKHRVTSGSNELRIVVRGRPASIAVDPLVHRIDAERRDNVRPVSQATGRSEEEALR